MNLKNTLKILCASSLSLFIAALSAGQAVADDSDTHSQSLHQSSDQHGFSYNYTEARYLNVSLDDDGVDLDGTGFEIEGSIGLGQHFQAFAGYEDIGFDHDVDISEWVVGFGAHRSILPGLDLVANLGYVSEDVETSHGDHSDDGYLANVGIRKKVGEQGEFLAKVEQLKLDEVGSTTSIELAGEMHVTSRLALGLGVDISDDVTTYFAEARYYIGKH